MPERRGTAGIIHDGVGRNARSRRGFAIPTISLIVAATSACHSSRPEFLPPRPSEAIVERSALDVEPAAALELPSASAIAGDIRFIGGDPGDVDLGPVVVYLVPTVEEGSASGEREPAVITSRTPEFAPELAAVASGQKVVFANEGPLAHGLFSADMGNDRIDLPAGTRSAPIAVPPRGPVRFFCALHADESFLVYSGRTAHVSVVRVGEPFAFDPIDPGRYRLEIWSEIVSGPVREVVADGYSRKIEPVWIDAGIVRRLIAARDEDRQ